MVRNIGFAFLVSVEEFAVAVAEVVERGALPSDLHRAAGEHLARARMVASGLTPPAGAVSAAVARVGERVHIRALYLRRPDRTATLTPVAGARVRR